MNDNTKKSTIGKIYDPMEKELMDLRRKAHRLCTMYNQTFEEEFDKRKEILDELLPNRGEGVYIQGPCQFDYGKFTTIGDGSYMNFNFTCLDTCLVNIGKNVFIGPNVSLLTPIHPLLPEERNSYFDKDLGYYTDKEYGKPITIKDNCWIAGNVTVQGGVTIGEGCVIGCGSVVTRDIPDGYLAFGNPCRPIRKITNEDSIYLKKELF